MMKLMRERERDNERERERDIFFERKLNELLINVSTRLLTRATHESSRL